MINKSVDLDSVLTQTTISPSIALGFPEVSPDSGSGWRALRLLDPSSGCTFCLIVLSEVLTEEGGW